MSPRYPSRRDIECLICQAKTARNHYEIEDCLDLIDDMREVLERIIDMPQLSAKYPPPPPPPDWPSGGSVTAKSEWQPIETAPKDGKWVLVWGGETDEMMDIPRKECWRVVTAQYSCDRWQFAWFDGGFYGKFDKPPTHWMPLPEPPE